MEEIIKGNYKAIPKAAIIRMLKISDKIRHQMDRIIPILQRDLSKGQDIFMVLATNVRNVIDAVIGDIHLNTLRSSKTYDDVYERFGPDRRIISVIIFILIFIVSLTIFITDKKNPF